MLIEVYADVVCPWCYIGRGRLRRALAERPEVRAEPLWRPFQLNPEMPPGGLDRGLYLAAKFGGPDRARQVYGAIAEAAARDGLPLALERIRRTPSTLDAHRLVLFAAARGRQEEMVDVLYRAYFVLGLDVGDRDVLAGCASAAGLDGDEAAAHLASDEDADAVRTSDLRARQLGIQAVPFHIFDRRYAVAGAQEPGAFSPLLDLAPEVSG